MLPAAVRRELEAIHAAHPERLLQPVAVVQAASNPASALHPHFEWDDRVAGHQYRVDQARRLIRTVYVVPPPEVPRKVETVYLSLQSDRGRPGGGYRVMQEVLVDDVLREEMLQTALIGLRAWMWRYRMFEDLVASVAQASKVVVPTQEPSAREQARGRRGRRRRAS